MSSNIPPQTLNDIVNVLNPQQQQHIFSAFMNGNNGNRNMQMGMNPAVVANTMQPNNMNNMTNNQQLFNTFRALQQQPMNQTNNMMNGQTLNNAQAMNMNMNVQNNTNIPMQNNMNNDTSNYLLQFLQQQLTTPPNNNNNNNNNNNLRNPVKQVMPNNTNTIVQQNNGMIANEQQMMGGFTNGMDSNMMNMNSMANMTNMANMGMANVNGMNNMNNMNNIGNPTTPMSQMTGTTTVPTTINMSQQRSGTPLSNNSGGVLSSNTNTTTNTQSGVSATGMRRFSVEQIKLVQQLIEQCLKLYLSKEETMDFLCKKYDNIERAFINLMWCKLEQQNPDFFKAYNTRLLIKEQISQFNQLVKEQAGMMQQQGLLVQNNTITQQMPSTPTGGPMIGVQQVAMPNIGIMPQNIQSPYNSASSPVTSQNAFNMMPNQPNVNNNGVNPNNGAFVYPQVVNGAGNFGINLQNAAVLGINNFQQPNNGMIPQNMNNNAVLNFAQQQNMYRQQQQPTNSQPNFNNSNNSNTLSPQKQQMNVNLGLGNETATDSNPQNMAMFGTNAVNGAGADISQMITHLLSSPAPVSTTTPQAKQTIQNFLKSPLVKVGRDVEEKLRSLLNDEQSATSNNNTNVNTTDMNRQISNTTPVTNNSATGTSTPTIIDTNTPNVTTGNNNNQNPSSDTPNLDVFEFDSCERDVFGVGEFDDDDFFHHDE